MSTTPSYPGVYIEEVPSGTRTITGVATSIAAFVGRTLRGPMDPTTVFNWTEFTRQFGGLWKDSTTSYAVQQFFQNGGGQAIILRTVDSQADQASSTTTTATKTLSGPDALKFEAETPGTGSNGIKIAFANPTTAGEGNFKITITDNDSGHTQLLSEDVSTHRDSTTPPYLGDVIDPATHKVHLVGDVPLTVPSPGTITLAGGMDSGPDGPVAAYASTSVAATDLLSMEAANPGAWGANLEVHVDRNTRDPARYDLFNLTVREFVPGTNPREYVRTETYLNVSVITGDSRNVHDVLEQQSELLRVTVLADSAAPPVGTWDLGGGDNGAEVDDNDIVAALDGLDHVDLYNLLCIPPLTFDQDIGDNSRTAAVDKATHDRAIFLADAPSGWNGRSAAVTGMTASPPLIAPNANTALYFPWLELSDPLKEGRTSSFAPCGAVAGVIARTDAQRGVWKAPAGLEAGILGVRGLGAAINDDDQGQLNPLALNVVRSFPVVGTVVWGSRTLRGADILADQWKYLPVRRLALFIEESLYRGTQWAVFEPNDEPLWAQLRTSVGSFMHELFRKGAFQGSSPRKAYFVKCDGETTTQTDIDLGVVNVLVGFAPLKPAEFVIIKLQQLAGEAAA